MNMKFKIDKIKDEDGNIVNKYYINNKEISQEIYYSMRDEEDERRQNFTKQVSNKIKDKDQEIINNLISYSQECSEPDYEEECLRCEIIKDVVDEIQYANKDEGFKILSDFLDDEEMVDFENTFSDGFEEGLRMGIQIAKKHLSEVIEIFSSLQYGKIDIITEGLDSNNNFDNGFYNLD